MDIERTTTSLLEGLFDSDNEIAWSHFDARYRPIVLGFARKMGLNEVDASEVAQETIVQFLKEYKEGKYDRERGRLRSWLIGIARFRVAGVYRGKSNKREYRGESAMITLPTDEDACVSIWDTERRTNILQQALRELRANSKASDQTIQAFEMLVLNKMPVATVAETLDMSRDEVYMAKSRTAARLKDIIDRFEKLYDEDEP
ncbi:MAG: hypothetical protein CMJ36_01490 [Phycisphaerae bacterium]|nr:hypothetical protein [Phycisphaerae bacterium]